MARISRIGRGGASTSGMPRQTAPACSTRAAWPGTAWQRGVLQAWTGPLQPASRTLSGLPTGMCWPALPRTQVRTETKPCPCCPRVRPQATFAETRRPSLGVRGVPCFYAENRLSLPGCLPFAKLRAPLPACMRRKRARPAGLSGLWASLSAWPAEAAHLRKIPRCGRIPHRSCQSRLLRCGKPSGTAFAGDAIFRDAPGTTEYPGGDAGTLAGTLPSVAASLPAGTRLFSGRSAPPKRPGDARLLVSDAAWAAPVLLSAAPLARSF